MQVKVGSIFKIDTSFEIGIDFYAMMKVTFKENKGLVYEAIMADFRNSEKVKNGRLMSFLLSRGLMAFACVCTTLE